MNIWEESENRHDDYPWRERNDAVQFDRWWVLRMTARHAESEIPGTGKRGGTWLPSTCVRTTRKNRPTLRANARSA